MKKVSAQSTERINLGMQGENDACKIAFDVSGWQEKYGPGSVQLLVQRAGDERPYQAVLHRQDELAIWSPTRTDTEQAGNSSLQLMYFVKEKLIKSNRFTAIVRESLGQPDEKPPKPQIGFANEVAANAARAEQAADRAGQHAAYVQEMVEGISLIDRLCSPFAVKGEIVSCQPVAEYPLSVVSELPVKQGGEGKPTRYNVRPIQMWTEPELMQYGRNLLDMHSEDVFLWNVSSVQDKLVSGIRNEYYCEIQDKNPAYVKKGMKLTFSVQGNMLPSLYCGAVVFGEFTNGMKFWEYVGVQGRTSVTFTVPETLVKCTAIHYRFNQNTQKPFMDTATTFTCPMVSTQESPWEEHHKKKYSTKLEQSVLGGTLNWNQGILRSSLMQANGLKLKAVENTPAQASDWFSILTEVCTGHQGREIICCDKAAVMEWDTLSKKATLSDIVLWNSATCSGVAIPYRETPGMNRNATPEQKRQAAADCLDGYNFVYRTQMTEFKCQPVKVEGVAGTNHICMPEGITQVCGRTDPMWEHQQLRDAITALSSVSM